MKLLIDTLLLFLSPEERQFCSHPRVDNSFIPNLYIQGIAGEFDCTTTSKSLRPTSVIDVSKMTILQLIAVRQHAKAREMYASYQLESLDKGSATLPDLLKVDNLFKHFKGLYYFVL